MKKYFLTLFIIPVLFFAPYDLASAQAGGVSGVTPTSNTTWSIGSNDVSWFHINNNFYNFNCPWHIDLIPYNSTSLPTYNGTVTSSLGGQGQGIITLSSGAIPGDYKVRAWCTTNVGGDSGESIGVVTVSNPSYKPFTITSPTWIADQAFTVSYTVSNLPVGAVINYEWRSKTDGGTIVYSRTPFTNDRTSAWSDAFSIPSGYSVTGKTYYAKIWSMVAEQEYGATSADVTVPRKPTVPTITNLNLVPDKTNYAVGDTININWQVTGISSVKDLTLKRYRVETIPPDTLIVSIQPDRLLNYGPVTVGSAFTNGKSYYYTLSNAAGTASAQSNTFTITETGGNGNGGGFVFAAQTPEWKPPTYTPPNCTDANGHNPDPGCFPPINVSGIPQWKNGTLGSNFLVTQAMVITSNKDYNPPLSLGVDGKVGATEYCDKNGNNCIAAGTPPGSSGVSQIIAGSNISISPTSGIGAVTINSTGGTGTFDSSGIANCIDNGTTYKKIVWNGTQLVCGEDKTTGGATGDNLGNHTATQNIKLNGFWLSSDGGSEGVYVDNSGNVALSNTIKITGGNPANDKVLTATNSAGNAEWRTPAPTAGGITGIIGAGGLIANPDGSGTANPVAVSINTNGVTTAKIADGNVTTAKIAPAATDVNRVLVSSNGTVGWGSPVYTREYFPSSGDCGPNQTCSINANNGAPPYIFCALAKSSTAVVGGKCEVGPVAPLDGRHYAINAVNSNCKAVCISQ